MALQFRLRTLLLVVLLVALALGWGRSAWLQHSAEARLAKYESQPPEFASIGRVVVNLNEKQLIYLSVDIQLETPPQRRGEIVAAIARRRPAIQSWLVKLFSGKKAADVQGTENIEALQQQIKDALPDKLGLRTGDQAILEVHFAEFQIQ